MMGQRKETEDEDTGRPGGAGGGGGGGTRVIKSLQRI